MDQGDHLVTISTGPQADDDREVATGFLDSLVTNMSQLEPVLGPDRTRQLFAKAVKLRNLGPIGDEIVNIIAPEDQQQGKPDPAQLMQQIKHAEDALHHQAAEIADLKAGNQTKIQIADMDNKTKIAIAAADHDAKAADREVKLAVAELSAKVKDLSLFMEERARLGVHEHEAAMAAAGAGHEADMADQAHQRELQLQREGQAHDVNLANTPPPPDPNQQAGA
jgi:hypothetical protein